MAVLEVKELTKKYGEGESEVIALDHVSFSVERGEFVAIIGASGSGKSTLMNMIGGIDYPTSGSIIIDAPFVQREKSLLVANITEDIRNGNTEYLNDFLNAVISEGIREGVTDIFGEGVEIDDSEAVQTARRAKELLDKLQNTNRLQSLRSLKSRITT